MLSLPQRVDKIHGTSLLPTPIRIFYTPQSFFA